MSLLTLEDAIIAKTMLERHAKSRDVQKATRDEVTGMRKPRISDVNNLKYSFTRGEGVSNLGEERLKGFPIAFAQVFDETETSYAWFVKSLKSIVLERIEDCPTFVTEKCKTLINALDSEPPVNKKLLCGWHMINNIAKMAKKTMKAGEDRNTCTNLINGMKLGDNADNDKVKSFEEYFEKEWMSFKEKWAGYLTSKLKNFDCVTVQRVESDHRALKRSISTLQSLDSSFEKICLYLLQLEGDYQDSRLDKELVIDARILGDKRLCELVNSVSRIALFTIHIKFEEATVVEVCYCSENNVWSPLPPYSAKTSGPHAYTYSLKTGSLFCPVIPY
ncbi:hypothetical protein PHYBLDRAFT_152170 [Phycomyces blakesleeanus NRRL 1555(-)]|uniref:MULE transposase domain-containing protein n=1 Tax=Phycomyces blakesleeanus (strain ATCC 8743b / DSM 1359 / FGSC 10004 / NBRC 33097 / NRRL 1555) TaxID=763407 RepID=A0A162WEN8_PHYB8|nr:hypothetical protein PHYBLDRAFT_152170 [Phycomyces blakesleeanus NRRL 1555(-)]OAD66625.1 hypothetical protein PHYBLDRAFT_152170 [Phycomyces blakesleeanus NRRL 1555(-)]|eukprot:XP_018284665.1 hypothetical protein PHYBLDRAFT_152170 [Phycomyces blakesleeanus NRRL 1555(-)]